MWLVALVGLAACSEPEQRTSSFTVLSLRDGRAAPTEVSAPSNGKGTATGCGVLGWPVVAAISSGFGLRDGHRHEGIDLPVPRGTPVHAACDGTVVYAGDKLRGYGRLILVSHAGGLVTVYAHNDLLEVTEGQHVTRGQELARSGQTGHATAPHVHFEVRRDNHPLDPLEFLPAPGRAKLWAALHSTD